jgi:hypothetical protein
MEKQHTGIVCHIVFLLLVALICVTISSIFFWNVLVVVSDTVPGMHVNFADVLILDAAVFAVAGTISLAVLEW